MCTNRRLVFLFVAPALIVFVVGVGFLWIRWYRAAVSTPSAPEAVSPYRNYDPIGMAGLWVAQKKYAHPIVGVLANGKRVEFPNEDPFHTISAVNRCKRYVYEDLVKAGGPQWCVSYGCRCLVAPGSLIGNEPLDPPNGVLIGVLRY